MPSQDEMTCLLTEPLAQPQVDLLRVVSGPMLAHGRWPTLYYVQSQLRQHGYEPDEVIHSMPFIGSLEMGKVGYSAIWHQHRSPQPDSVVRLTMAAALHLPEYQGVAEYFMKALRIVVAEVEEHRPTPWDSDDPHFKAGQLVRGHRHFTAEFIAAFPKLINFEPFTLTGGFTPGTDGEDWSFRLKPFLLNYKGVISVTEYVGRVAGLIRRENARYSIGDTSATAIGSGNTLVTTATAAQAGHSQENKKVPMAGFNAHMFTLLIASPGDTKAERDIVEQVALELNASQIRAHQRGLHPLRWERDSVPGFGDGPQAIINEDGDSADIVIALFRARVGTPTSMYASGSIEEVERAVERGVPVHVVFLDYGVKTSDIDTEQLARLNEWKRSLAPRGLFEQVESEQQLRSRLRHFLERDLHKLGQQGGSVVLASSVGWTAEAVLTSNNSYRLVLTPSAEATDVEAWITEEDNPDSKAGSLPTLRMDGKRYLFARRLPAGQPLVGRLLISIMSGSSFNVRVKWLVNNEERSEVITVSR